MNDTSIQQKPIEERFRLPDGMIDYPAAQAELQRLQSAGESLTNIQIREAIQLIRLLRRTNTGPSAAKKKAGKKTISSTMDDPDDLLSL